MGQELKLCSRKRWVNFLPIYEHLMGPLIKLEAFMFPTTHFVIISRGIFVKGNGLPELQGYVLALLALGGLFFALTALMFKKKLA